AHDGAMGALPSLHAAWALLAAFALAARWPSARGAALAWAAAVAASCVTTGQHALLDVLAGVLLYAAAARRARVWEALRGAAERVANSWHEWRLGPLRLINHGAWAGAGAATGLALAETLAGPRTGELLALALPGLLVAGLWAQLVEGSPALLRPFGYYGGVIGIALGALGLAATGRDAWPALAALAAAGPWIQALGRLRCLVQGCCHGRPCAAWLGLRYRHPRSRVVRLAGLRDVPVHPTPVYSMLACVVAGALLARLWWSGAPLTFIVGAYLLLNGLSRFVEESFRGEPQTPRAAGLAIYQWKAAASVLMGAVITALPGAPAPPPHAPGAMGVLGAIGFGLLCWAAMGLDWPESQRRFSRLA
ncbi:MAG TPA: prolipoprotein diacylglyceryl transferase family protein, partial [Planctomycetota bacterium]|nr:prolipoprotein diacylglyceryl transferase family protein [Planctomycetota bacterium]